MVQFNLLPDVKLDYIKTRRTKHSSIVLAVVVAGIALTLLVLLFLVVNVVQKKHLSDLNKDIKSLSTKLEQTPDLNKILTIQNQLHSLNDLHANKKVASRLAGYLAQVTPAQVSISRLHVDMVANSMTIDGTADQLSSVNKYADTLKFTTFQADNKKGNAFTNVVLSSFSRGDKSNYTLSLSFDPIIFDGAQNVSLVVPKTITTRSETEKPSALFQGDNTQGGQ